MSAWDPAQYLKFSDSRTRPAAELLARIPLDSPARVVDLGCGPGNSTALLKQRWPGALTTGVDNSADMLAAARRTYPDWTWEEADIGTWVPKEPVDLIFSNATLHWLPEHETLFSRLIKQLRTGGVLAVQMPNNFKTDAHLLIRKIAEDEPWQGILAGVEEWHPPLAPSEYYKILSPQCSSIDIWETEYVQVMDSAAAIVEWNKGSALRPFLNRLSGIAQREFLARYTKALSAAYQPQSDGRVLFPFKRIFLIGRGIQEA